MATIVLAENDLHILRVVSMLFKQHRYEVIEAPNGQQALKLVLSRKPDVLITDVNMPAMDGITLVKACALEHLPRVGVVMLTSHCDQADLVEALRGLPVMFHAKPFSPSRLVRQVEEMLNPNTADVAETDAAVGR